MEMTAIVTPFVLFPNAQWAWNRVGLAGIRTRSGTLLPVPGKMRLFQGGAIIPQEFWHNAILGKTFESG
jgi:hypothetical protein